MSASATEAPARFCTVPGNVTLKESDLAIITALGNGPLTRSELKTSTGYSAPTIRMVLRRLESIGIVELGGRSQPARLTAADPSAEIAKWASEMQRHDGAKALRKRHEDQRGEPLAAKLERAVDKVLSERQKRVDAGGTSILRAPKDSLRDGTTPRPMPHRWDYWKSR